MNWIVVDDLRKPSSFFYAQFGTQGRVFTNTEDALVFIKQLHENNERVKYLFLDHDLGESDERTLTVTPVVDELVELALTGESFNVDVVIAHTANPVGADMIKNALTIPRLNGVYVVKVRNADSVGLTYS